MEGASKRQVNAEEMLAELKRALESSTRAPNVPPPSPLTVSKPSSVDRESRRSQIDERSSRPIKANAEHAIRQSSDGQRPAKPSSRGWKLTAGGLALAGVAAVCANLALTNKTPNLPKRELSAVATEGPARPQNEQALEPSSDSRSPMQDGRQQVGNLETRPEVSRGPANSSSLPAVWESEVAAPHPASFGLETTMPAFTPAPPNPAAAPGASQTIRPDGAPIATAPSTPASIDSAPPAETPKPNATPPAHASNESARASAPKIDSRKRLPGKTSLKKPAKSAKASAKPVVQVGRQSPVPARPKEAESPPQPAQDAGNPTAAAPVPATIQQRFADGISHAFSYVTHLPGALVPHPADPNADAH